MKLVGWVDASKLTLFFNSQSYLLPPFQCDDCRDSDRPWEQIPSTTMIVLKRDRVWE
ncbi:MAG TPA: hypothetical protein V6D48_24430 [Oculatellaceae cyanobacterium]